jgi:hypothetical protein
VREGSFNAELELDQQLAARDSVWVQVEVRDAKGGFVPLAERTEVRPKETAAGVCWEYAGQRRNQRRHRLPRHKRTRSR